MLRDATLAKFLELARQGEVLESFNRADMVATLKGQRKVLFRTGSDPDRLRGPNLSWIFLDEAAMLSRAVFLITLGRLRVEPANLWATSTPRGRNWLFDEWGGDKPGRFMVKAATRTNPFLPPDFADAVEASYDADFSRQELGGEFLEDPTGRLIWADWIEAASVLRPTVPDKHDPIVHGPCRIACDPSEGRGADRSTILVRDDLGVLHMESSNRLDPSGIAERIHLLRGEYGVTPGYISIDGAGGCGRDTLAYLKRYGIAPKQYFGGGTGGMRFFNLRSAAAWRFREAMQSGGFGLARVGTLLPALRKELQALSYHMNGDKLALIQKADLSKEIGCSPDLADALIQSFSY